MFSAKKFSIIPVLILLILSLAVTSWAQYRHKKLFEDRYVHEPVATGECTVCHGMHFPEAPGQLAQPVPLLCFECHDNPASGKPYLHSPAGEGQCMACHYPHSSSRPGLTKRSTVPLCTGCHKKKEGGRHGEAVFEGDCTRCHDPHASGVKYLLKGVAKGDCVTCHQVITEEAFVHTAVKESGCPECHNPHSSPPLATLPCLQCHSDLLGGALVHEAMEEGCAACHMSHSGQEPMQLNESLPDLCLGCHDEMSAGRHGKMSVGLGCTRCHTPHSSEAPGLLTDSVRRGQCAACHVEIVLKEVPHTPVSTNRCQRCHDPHTRPPVPIALCQDCHGGILDGRYDHEAALEGCGNCHDAHGSSLPDNLTALVPELCTDCHGEMEGGRHGDILLSTECGSCHDPHSALQPKLLTMLKEKASCSTCHRSQSEGKVVHTPVRSAGCDQCHAPHVEPPVPTTQCTDCHTDITGGTTEGLFRHAALEEGCDACHDTHTSGQGNLLTTGIPDLCLQCHDEKRWGKHGDTVLDEECGSCHEPHASSRKGLLRVLGDRSCPSCHSEKRSGPYVHSALSEFECGHCHDPHADPPVMPPLACQSCHPDISDRSVSHGTPSLGRCLECHDPHSAGSIASVQHEESTGRDDCLECHRDIARKLERERTIHAPVSGDECTVCHTNHSGEPPFTKQVFSNTKYVPYDPESYELCFSCHSPGLVQVKYTETDTGFRQNRWNLHNLHVVRDGERGFSCWVCHDSHSSDQAHLLNREVPFNTAYNLKIEFKKIDNGGECRTNCHTVKEYLR
ncbi:MAG: cytochrome c3 family protein [bacterium]|nr:cytochrome c3 family protein [bacterium]